MVKSVKWVLGVATVVAASLLLFAVTASAAPTHGARVRAAHASGTAGSGLPNVKIKLNHRGKPSWKPMSLTVASHWNGVQACTRRHESFKITNTTADTENVDYSGALFASLAPGQATGVCAVGGFLYQFTLEGSASVLSVTIT
jgi:hypothetical protein